MGGARVRALKTTRRIRDEYLDLPRLLPDGYFLAVVASGP